MNSVESNKISYRKKPFVFLGYIIVLMDVDTAMKVTL